ncbi:MAG: alpha/beta fold hydrolase [Oscillospiraceae bacterium]|nr:alpha/beta fold hydrolase [Oscillospiraceae bacterium]
MKYQSNEMIITVQGGTIYGKAFMPEDTEGRLPAVILSHGYNSSHEDLSDLAAALAEHGVFAYAYDFRGGSMRSKSSGKTTEMSIQSEMDDLRAVLSYIDGLDYVDSEKKYLYGESQGGFVSALTADKKVKGLYLLYPAFCIPDNWEGRTIDGEVDFMGMPLSNRFCEGLPEYDVFEHIKKYEGAVKIYHGDSDKLVPLSYAQKAAESFKNSELTVFGGEGHGFSSSARKKLVDLICEDFT